MKKIFNFKDIAYLKQYAPVEITDEMVEKHFEYMVNRYEDELDKSAYVELIKQTARNMTDLPDKVNKNIFRSIYNENDLDKLAGYYKLSENLAYDEDDDLWDNFKEDQGIYPIADLWDRMDNELKKYGTNANLYLVSDLLQMDKNIEWVKLNAYERANGIRDIHKEFEDWIAGVDLEDYISSYDKEDFIKDFELKEALEKEKLANKEEKALVM